MANKTEWSLILATMIVLPGCATHVPERHRGSYAGSQGSASTLVFDSPGVVERLAFAPEAWELTRRDAAMSPKPIAAANALDEWPAEARPSLSRARRIHLREDSRTIIYFDRQGPRSSLYYGHPYY